jgi:hypothetical protein
MAVRFTSFVELALGADLTAAPSSWSWTDITDYVHHPDGIAITRGRGDQLSQAPPASCSLTLQNQDGRFTPRNPTGAWYGTIGRNTPLRVLVRPNTNSQSDTFNRSASSSWGSADTGGSWTNTGGAASDFSVAAASGGRHTHTSATSPHYSTLPLSVLRSDIRVRVKTAALAAGAPLTAAIVVRWTDASNSNRFEIRFNTDQTISARLASRVAGVDGANATTTVSGLSHAAGTWYWVRAQIGQSSARIKVWQDGTTEPAGWNIDGSSGFLPLNASAAACGLYSIRETGNSNANATIDFDDYAMFDGVRIQFTGYVDEWPARWADQSASFALAPIVASGLLRRIQQGAALRSALYRAHTEDYYLSTRVVKAYWPCEDASGSTSIASGVGGPAMTITGEVNLAADSTIAGSDPLPTSTATTILAGPVPVYPTSTTWAIRWVMSIPTAPASTNTLMRWYTGGTLPVWQLNLVPGGGIDLLKLEAYDASNVEQIGDTGADFAQFGTELYGRQVYFEVTGTQNGANIDWTYQAHPGGGKLGSEAGTIGNVTAVRFGAGYGNQGIPGTTVGHIAVATDSLYGAGLDGTDGYAGETTDERLFRLCNEQNVAALFGELTNIGAVTTQTMGPQTTTTFINQLREIEATEAGVLHDGKQGHLTLLPRGLRANRAVDLTLAVDSSELGWPFEPTDDDKDLRNDITVNRTKGSSARATDAASVAAVGVYADTVTVNTADDADLAYHAGWRLNLGTVDDLRYPQIVLKLTRSQTLIEDWLDCDIGARIQVADVPAGLPPDDLDLHIEGYTETIDNVDWTVTLNTSPARPWQVFELEDTDLGRLESTGSSLLTSATAGATSLLVATTEIGPQWSTTAEPYNWHVAGEKITVTTMNTNAVSFVAAGTASHGDNTSLTPSLPAGVQQGDLLLVFAAIRSSGTGTVNTPTGYTALLTFGNIVLLGKTHTGSESAPTVTFTGGAVGDTTSAQMAAFRYAQCSVVTSATQLNGSAQNIATPALTAGLDRARMLILYLGWKQDDWTSVATLAGAEIGEPFSTTGNDQGLVWDYVIQTSVAEIAASSFVVTGGAAAISRGAVVAIKGDVQSCTVTRAVNGVSKAQAAGAAVSLWRPGVLSL